MGKLLESFRSPTAAIAPSPLDDRPPTGIIRSVNNLRSHYDDSPTLQPERLHYAAPPRSKGVDLPQDIISRVKQLVSRRRCEG